MTIPPSDSQIDEVILSVAVASWRKVARIITDAHKIAGESLPDGDRGLDLIAGRIEALVKDGRLLAQRNLKLWRFSEVRKAD